MKLTISDELKNIYKWSIIESKKNEYIRQEHLILALLEYADKNMKDFFIKYKITREFF